MMGFQHNSLHKYLRMMINGGLIVAIIDQTTSGKGAKREFERAIELNPNYAGAHYFLGLVVLAPLGRFDEAIAELEEPFAVRSIGANSWRPMGQA